MIVSDYSQMDRILREERQYILDICKKIKKAGCNVLLIQKSILRCLPVCCLLYLYNSALVLLGYPLPCNVIGNFNGGSYRIFRPIRGRPHIMYSNLQAFLSTIIVRTAELQTFPSNDSLKPKSFIDTVAYETKMVY